MVVPAGQEMATRADLEREISGLRAEMNARFATLEERMQHMATKTFVLASQVPVYVLLVGLYFAR